MPIGMSFNLRPAAEMLEWSRRADAAGFDEIWLEGGWVHISAATIGSSRAVVAQGVMPVFDQEPVNVASLAATLAGLSNGRFILGLGAALWAPRTLQSPPDVSHPAPRLGEYMQLLRRIWSGEGGRFEGRFFSLGLRSIVPPHPISIYVGALQPAMIRMAGRVADGVCGHPFWPARWARDVIVPALREAAGSRSVPVSGQIFTGVHEDRTAARNAVRRYYGRSLARRAGIEPLIAFMGWERQVAALRAAVAANDDAALLAAMDDGMVDEVAITGTPDEARRLFAERWAGVYDVPVFTSPGGPLDDAYLANTIATFGRG